MPFPSPPELALFFFLATKTLRHKGVDTNVIASLLPLRGLYPEETFHLVIAKEPKATAAISAYPSAIRQGFVS